MHTLLLSLALAASEPTLLDSVPSIHVTGVGKASAAPDKVDVFIQISTEDATVEAAMKENAARMTAVMAATRAHGVEAKDVQLSAVSMSTRQEYEPSTNRYKGMVNVVRKDLVLCLRATQKLDALLIDLAKAKALVTRIDFASDALKASEEGLFVKAVENARKKADQMAAAVGAKTGRALKITTAHEYGGAGSSRAMETYSTGGGVSVGEAATGALSATTTVQVDFELVPSGK